MKIVTKNVQETVALGREFAKKLKGGEILALVGDLGSGKTTFAQGLASGLRIRRRIISPTFIIMRYYPVTRRPNNPRTLFYHVDLYRLEENLGQEIKNLGLTDIWGRRENIVVIEWAEKIKAFLPDNTIWVKFETVDNKKRCISYIDI